MGMKSLAEAIIMQSMTDLWDENEREDSLKFFKGEDFSICAEMAGINLSDQIELMTMLKKSVKHGLLKKKTKKGPARGGDIKFSRLMKASAGSLTMAI